MELIGVLSAGVRGAENGTVEIYERGTSTLAELFTSAEGDGGYVPTAGLALDSHGGVETYCELSVDCIAFDSTGQVVRRFTQMHAAANVEVRSQSFTGTDYTTGASAASNPVDAATVFNRWLTSAGTLDWNVLIDGASTTLQNAFASFAGMFFNVKAPVYGAKGDSATNDTSAIQAAIAAAALVSGVVFFPPGTYRITSALTIPEGVSLMGCSSYGSYIVIDHATANGLVFSAQSTIVRLRATYVFGLNVGPFQDNSGKHVAVESGSDVIFFGCSFGASLLPNTTGQCVSISNAATRVTFVSCQFLTNGAAASHIQSLASGYITAIGCRFVHGGGTFNGTCVRASGGGQIVGCTFDLSAVAVGASAGIVLDVEPPCVIVGSRIVNPGVPTVIVSRGATVGSTAAGAMEFGLLVPSNILPPTFLAVARAASNHEGSWFTSRETRRGYETNNSANMSVPANHYGTYEVRRTNNGNQTLTFDSPIAPGLAFTLVYNNDHGAGGGTITPSAETKGLANFAVNANRASLVFYRSYENAAAGGAAGSYYWGYVTTTANVTL